MMGEGVEVGIEADEDERSRETGRPYNLLGCRKKKEEM